MTEAESEDIKRWVRGVDPSWGTRRSRPVDVVDQVFDLRPHVRKLGLAGAGTMSPRDDRDQEDRANLALGALDAVHDLIAGLDPLNRIDPNSFAYLFDLVRDACRDAIPDGGPRHARAINDDEGG